jgi:hypothetical protein
MEYRKIAVALVFSLCLVSHAAAADLVVDGLEAEKVNETFMPDGIRFETSYVVSAKDFVGTICLPINQVR